MVYLHEYGVGDEAVVPARAALRRIEPGVYEVRANTPCAISLPGREARVSPDGGRTWKPLKAEKIGGGQIAVSLDEAAFGGGLATLDVR